MIFATINRNTLQLEALDSKAPKLVGDPYVVIDFSEGVVAYKQFDALHFSFLELLVLYRNLSDERGFVTDYRDTLISMIKRLITHGKPLSRFSANLWDERYDPSSAHSTRTAHANDRPHVTAPAAAPKRTSTPRSSAPRDTEPPETRNGVTRYRKGTGGDTTWIYFDEHPAIDRSELAKLAADNGWAEASVRKVFAQWKKFNFVSS